MEAHTFESILKELGEKIGIPNLEPTKNNNITLTLKNKINVTLQLHKDQPLLIISFKIVEIPASRYRENVLREALKFNGLNKQQKGVFAFSKKTQTLILFEMLPLDHISSDQVKTVMMSLSEKAALWKETLNRGEIPSSGAEVQAKSNAGIFGIRP